MILEMIRLLFLFGNIYQFMIEIMVYQTSLHLP